MKKSLITTLATGSVLALGLYAFSFQNNQQMINSGLTLQTLIAKADAAVEQKATEGRYYYQKTKTILGGKGSTMPTEMINELWLDKESRNAILVFRDEVPDQINWANISKDGMSYNYSAKGEMMSKHNADAAITHQAESLDFRRLTPALKAFIEGSDDIGALKEFFPHWNIDKDSSIQYAGKTIFRQKSLETLVAEDENHYVQIRIYFDPQNFKLVGLESIYKPDNKLMETTEVVTSDYSDQIPSVLLGSTTLSLDPSFIPQGNPELYWEQHKNDEAMG